MYDTHYVKKSEKHEQRQAKLCLHGFFKKMCNLQIYLVSLWSFFTQFTVLKERKLLQYILTHDFSDSLPLHRCEQFDILLLV